METIGAFDAKTRLSELLDRAAKGESFVITKHGHPVARLVPENGHESDDLDQVVEDLKAFRGSLKATTIEEIVTWKHEGHRF